jgi:hypothetical protein
MKAWLISSNRTDATGTSSSACDCALQGLLHVGYLGLVKEKQRESDVRTIGSNFGFQKA